MEVAIDAARWVVGSALGPLSGGLLEAWAASSELGPNIDAVKMELLYAKGMLDNVQGREIRSQALTELLQKLQQLAYDAEDALDELDYFRIHDELEGTYEAADVDDRGCFHGLILNSRHTAKAVGKLLLCSCTAASHGDPDKPGEAARRGARCGACPCGARSAVDIPSGQADQKVGKYMRRLTSSCAHGTAHAVGKCLPCYSFPLVHGDDDDVGLAQNALQDQCGACLCNEMPMLKFDRVGMSRRMKHVVEQLQHVCAKVSTILNLELLGSNRNNIQDIAMSQRITISQSVEPKLYGRDKMKTKIIHEITQGKYCDKDLSILPMFGPGGIGKTTLVQYIYSSQEVQSHFQVKIWVCVSLNLNVSRLIQEIEKSIPSVEDEKRDGSTEGLIEQRLKSKRFLLILDDMWKCGDEDEWKRLLIPFNKGQAKGNIVIVTTRFPAIAEMVKTTEHPIELERLEDEEFTRFFEACVFGDKEPREGHSELFDTGSKIMTKLKGFPLAAKTVGRLLRNNLTLDHWMRVLASKEWELQTGDNDIMPALQLSYVYLPFHLQKCFSYCALFPEDHEFDAEELIHLWMGLGILCSSGRNKRVEDLGLSYLIDLVNHGFFKANEKDGHPCYVIHDLLHDLARRVSSHECLSINCSNARDIEIPPSIRHLSITMGDVYEDGTIGGNVRRDLSNIGKRFKAENLHTLMIFGEYDRSFANAFGDMFRKTKALRVLRLFTSYYSVEDILHNFSKLVHLRHLRLESEYDKGCLPRTISRLYKLIVLDLKNWKGSVNLPTDMSNLMKLRHFIVSHDEPHSKISEVGKLQFLQESRRFEVKKENDGFELRQLGQLIELGGSLSICNLEKVQVKEEANEAHLLSKNRLKKLTIEWDIKRSNKEPDKEAHVLDGLRPHDHLQELCIRGHGGPSCPTWLGSKLSVKNLQSLILDSVDWNVFPPLGEMWLHNEGIDCIRNQSFQNLKRLELVCLSRLKKWVRNDTCHWFSLLEAFTIRDCPELIELPLSRYTCQQDGSKNLFPRLQEFCIDDCPKLDSLPLIPWTRTLYSVDIRHVGSGLEKLVYSGRSSSPKLMLEIKENCHLHCLDEVVAFHNLSELQELDVTKCPPLTKEHLCTLTSLKTLKIRDSSNVLLPLEEPGDAKHKLPIERLEIRNCSASAEELTLLLWHLPELSFLWMSSCQRVTRLTVMEQLVAIELTSMPSSSAKKMEQQLQQRQQVLQIEEVGDDEGGLLLIPPHLSISLKELNILNCPELSLVPSLPSQSNPKAGGVCGVEGQGRDGGGLQGLRSLQRFFIRGCPKFLSVYVSSSPSCCPFPYSLDSLRFEDVEGIETLVPLSNLTTLTYLYIENCGKDLRGESLQPLLTQGHLTQLCVYRSPKFFDGWESWMVATRSEQQEELLPYSFKLQALRTDCVAGVLIAPICNLFSSSLGVLALCSNKEIVRFTKEQEKALGLITSLQHLCFFANDKLQSLPAGLHRLHNLKSLEILNSPAIRSLPKDGLPSSLQQIDVSRGCNDELKHQCIMLEGITLKIRAR